MEERRSEMVKNPRSRKLLFFIVLYLLITQLGVASVLATDTNTVETSDAIPPIFGPFPQLKDILEIKSDAVKDDSKPSPYDTPETPSVSSNEPAASTTIKPTPTGTTSSTTPSDDTGGSNTPSSTQTPVVSPAQRYSAAITAAETASSSPEISATVTGDSLALTIGAPTTAQTRVSLLGQSVLLTSNVIQIPLPASVASLQYALVIVSQNGVSYARYISLQEQQPVDSSSETSSHELSQVMDFLKNIS